MCNAMSNFTFALFLNTEKISKIKNIKLLSFICMSIFKEFKFVFFS